MQVQIKALAVGTGRGVRASRLNEVGARAQHPLRCDSVGASLGKWVMEPLGMNWYA
jgi:hypothetical protein